MVQLERLKHKGGGVDKAKIGKVKSHKEGAQTWWEMLTTMRVSYRGHQEGLQRFMAPRRCGLRSRTPRRRTCVCLHRNGAGKVSFTLNHYRRPGEQKTIEFVHFGGVIIAVGDLSGEIVGRLQRACSCFRRYDTAQEFMIAGTCACYSILCVWSFNSPTMVRKYVV